MFSRKPSGRRRALSVVVIVALIVCFAAVVLVRADRSLLGAEESPARAPRRVTAVRPVDPGVADARHKRLGRLEQDRDYAVVRGASHHRAPYLVPSWAAAGETLVLPPRAEPYDLGQVAAEVPQAFGRTVNDALLLRTILVVAPGATLVVDSTSVPDLALRSDRDGFVHISGVHASMVFRGHPGAPLHVTSYDENAGGVDTNYVDHRAYVGMRGGTLVTERARFTDLGFPSTGATSGVAWFGTTDHPATGSITDTVFQRNYFGAYTAVTHDLQVDGGKFLDNVVYGFDPHTATVYTVVKNSVATGNGRHGIIFSDGCSYNVVRDTVSARNGGAGFVIDDGTPAHGLNRASDHNTLEGVTATDNGTTGIAIEGGVGNAVLHSTVSGNPAGIRLRNDPADVRLVSNHVEGETSTGSWEPARFLHWGVLGVWVLILAVPAVALASTRRRTTGAGPASSEPVGSTSTPVASAANLIGPPRGGAVW